MTVRIYAVDVGSTNIKTVLYDDRLRALAIASAPARYDRQGSRVEFDAAALFETVLALIAECARQSDDTSEHDAVIALTGQAESLVLTDAAGDAVRPALSWMDGRAVEEAEEVGALVDADRAFEITGEPFSSATWPAAKLRWLRRHEPESLAKTQRVLMIKDYLVQRFAGTAVGEVTTRGFTYLWDVSRGAYWDAMLDFCGVPVGSLPEVAPAGTDVGAISPAIAERLPAARSHRLNVGALDHFCAMAGTGSYAHGSVSESAGTVLSLSLLAEGWCFDPAWQVSFHAGLRADDVVLFHGADSGGVALDWFRREGLADMPFSELEAQLAGRATDGAPIFLPYLTGVNPPDFLPHAKGAFLGIELGHDRIDMAYAVEEGITHLLRRMIEHVAPASDVSEIVSTGGGAESPYWNQLKADLCGVDVVVPDEREASCRGAAVLALVAAGELSSIEDASEIHTPSVRRFSPSGLRDREPRYELFDGYLQSLYQARPQRRRS